MTGYSSANPSANSFLIFMPDSTLTVGEAVDAYVALNDLDPSALGRSLTDEVVEAAEKLEPAVQTYEKKMDKHAERTDSEQELEEVRRDLRAEAAGVERPTIDVTAAPSIGALRALRQLDALRPVLSE